jgi:UDP-N-acetyl-D-glucosamine dehydrogenase
MSAVDVKAFELRFQRRDAIVGIVGLGYIGLPLALAAYAAGFRVIGFDINASRVSDFNHGISPLKQISNDRVRAMIEEGRFEASNDFGRLAEPDAILICVPTPLGRHHEPDLSHVENTARDIAASLRPRQLVVLESTSFPGTTREVVRTILET